MVDRNAPGSAPYGWQEDGSFNPCPACFKGPGATCANGGHPEPCPHGFPEPGHDCCRSDEDPPTGGRSND